MLYTLQGKTPIECADITEWAEFMADPLKRRVALSTVGQSTISTVFLGTSKDGGVFESLVMGGPMHRTCIRYESWDEAEQGHRELVAQVEKSWRI